MKGIGAILRAPAAPTRQEVFLKNLASGRHLTAGGDPNRPLTFRFHEGDGFDLKLDRMGCKENSS